MLKKPIVIHEFVSFISFFKGYIVTRFLGFGHLFERVKDVVVAFLVVKRGKYSSSFLNTSFFLLISATLIGGPVVAENNPFLSEYFAQDQAAQSVLATDIGSISFSTTISEKPRDKVVEYSVKEGDTLASIASKFDVSVDSIKWASKLKGDTIKAGSVIKIPPVDGVVHTVKSGESVYSIAKKYGTDAQAIVNFPFNEYADSDTFALLPGQVLYVPGGTPPAKRPRVPRRRVPLIVAGQPGTGSFLWPTTGSISQYPVWYHNALDIANKSLPPVVAADTGTVSYAACHAGGYGCHVIIDHGNGFQTLYAHLSRYDVSVGQGVSKGQTIGQVGSTGRSTGPHLHFEIRQGGRLLNPLSFLQ
ncbi:MAG: peptidoglycan DD-metalloendopeptidase family protein [Candidatus Paceibacterota bacterium]